MSEISSDRYPNLSRRNFLNYSLSYLMHFQLPRIRLSNESHTGVNCIEYKSGANLVQNNSDVFYLLIDGVISKKQRLIPPHSHFGQITNTPFALLKAVETLEITNNSISSSNYLDLIKKDGEVKIKNKTRNTLIVILGSPRAFHNSFNNMTSIELKPNETLDLMDKTGYSKTMIIFQNPNKNPDPSSIIG